MQNLSRWLVKWRNISLSCIHPAPKHFEIFSRLLPYIKFHLYQFRCNLLISLRYQDRIAIIISLQRKSTVFDLKDSTSEHLNSDWNMKFDFSSITAITTTRTITKQNQKVNSNNKQWNILQWQQYTFLLFAMPLCTTAMYKNDNFKCTPNERSSDKAERWRTHGKRWNQLHCIIQICIWKIIGFMTYEKHSTERYILQCSNKYVFVCVCVHMQR